MSCYRDLNPGPLPYQGSALPLSYNSRKSGRRDSNPRPSAWKANALSTELLPQLFSSPSNKKLWAVKDSNLRSRKTAELQSAPVGHFGNCPFFLCGNKGRFFNLNYQTMFAIFIAVIAASSPLFPCIPPALSLACCNVLVVNTPKITGHESGIRFNSVTPLVTLEHT